MTSQFLWSSGNVSSTVAGLVSPSPIVIFSSLQLNAATFGSVLSSTSIVSSWTLSTTYQAVWADLFYFLGSSASTVTWAAGSNFAGWFLTSPDQTSFESSTGLLPTRPPDFIIPLPATLAASNSIFATRTVMLPALPFRVLLQINCTGLLPSGASAPAPAIKAAPFALQY